MLDSAQTSQPVVIRRITAERVEFEGGKVVALKNPPWERVRPLIWW
jgi:hypothetical protein